MEHILRMAEYYSMISTPLGEEMKNYNKALEKAKEAYEIFKNAEIDMMEEYYNDTSV